MSYFSFGFVTRLDVDDMNIAQSNINTFFWWMNAITALFTVAMVGGIYWRLKTLKH
jgi:hypothetical protein